jgi:sialate O-acetylesterase
MKKRNVMYKFRIRLLLFSFVIFWHYNAYADDFAHYDLRLAVDLSGLWKFEIGDNFGWIYPEFEDQSWELIYVPSTWEDEGFPGYDGFAWYRKTFTISSIFKDKQLYLFLGFIDDVDEVYLNGKLVNFEGGMPPEVYTAYHIERNYPIPHGYINFDGENVIAVRVYDNYQVGGIVRGDVGIYSNESDIDLELNLAGKWKFRTGDFYDWKERDYADSKWDSVYVPALWETQGYRDFDGIAWYRKHFFLPEEFRNERLILLLGKIDDYDETYLNGTRIGRKGRIRDSRGRTNLGDTYQEIRAYYIPENVLLYGDMNLIAVRVYDGFIKGGIFEGPIGIVTRERYLAWWEQVKTERSKGDNLDFWDILKKLFIPSDDE